jgi:imidazoleglycerol-phosphate dehydratase/histidinol-phosphatase
MSATTEGPVHRPRRHADRGAARRAGRQPRQGALLPGVFAPCSELRAAGYRLVMVTNQDGLGTASFPQARQFEAPELRAQPFASQGIVSTRSHLPAPTRPTAASAASRKVPRWSTDYLPRRQSIRAARDRRSRHRPAVRAQPRHPRAARAPATARPRRNLARHRARAACARARHACAQDPETDIRVEVDLDAEGPAHRHRHRLLRPHARAARQARRLRARAGCKGDLHIDEHHTVEDCALALGEALRQALGDKRGIARYGFLLPMDEAARRWPSICPAALRGLRGEVRPRAGRRSADRAGAAFLPLAGRLARRGLHVSVTGDNTHHMIEACFKGVGRALRQAMRARAVTCPAPRACCEMADVVIIDSGGANLASLQFALERLGASAEVSADPERIRRAARAAARRRRGARRHGAPAPARPRRS